MQLQKYLWLCSNQRPPLVWGAAWALEGLEDSQVLIYSKVWELFPGCLQLKCGRMT